MRLEWDRGRDAVPDRVIGLVDRERFLKLVEALGTEDASIVLRLATGDSMRWLSFAMGVPYSTLRDRHRRALERLRRTAGLESYRDVDFLAGLRWEWKQSYGHGWDDDPPLCRTCHRPFSAKADGRHAYAGRPRRYCSDSCRQKAYRMRLRLGAEQADAILDAAHSAALWGRMAEPT
ncbi:hypothetical protein AB0L62_33240 [Nocardia asteroides]|uniref:hypothetical protein n=1 Tax=Nocardia asteroides TaxID=1824 RepID=UPI00341357B8